MLYYMIYSRLILIDFTVHFVKHFLPEVQTGEHDEMLHSFRPIKMLNFILSYNKYFCLSSV